MKKPIIDVSYHNGVLDWETIQPQIDGAILRCGYGSNLETQDDEQFERNAQECTRLDIPYGVYLFSYARNTMEALSEAEHVLRLVRDKNFDLPIYYDVEFSSYQGDLSPEQYTENTITFCERIRSAGGFVGVYANTWFWRNKLYDPRLNEYTRWVAEYADMVTLDMPYKLWQYTDKGIIFGSSEFTDLNEYYDDFLTEAGTDNHFADRDYDCISCNMQYDIGDVVTYSKLFIDIDTLEKVNSQGTGKITDVFPGVLHPYMIDNGLGFISDADIIK